MKDLINKGSNATKSRRNAEVAAFRALVSTNFDNQVDFSDTGEEQASAHTAAGDGHSAEQRSGVFVDSRPETDRTGGPGSNIHLPPGEVQALAAQALRALASGDSDETSDASVAQLFAVTEAYIAMDETARHEILARIMRAGVSSKELIEGVVPATARYMGELWTADRLSFADVTIGTARLQETVRTIGTRQGEGRDIDNTEGPAIMLVVPRIEQHTLGIFVVAEQFRRLGVRVHMTLGNNHAEILRLVRMHHFAMVGITASCRRTLASVRDLVKTIRGGVPRITPIVVGGPVTTLDLDIKSLTGVDYVASDAQEALRLCEIEIKDQRRLES